MGGETDTWLEQLFDVMDDDGDGSIEFFEFVRSAALCSTNCDVNNQVRLLFHCLADQNGIVTRAALAQAMDKGLGQRKNGSDFRKRERASVGDALLMDGKQGPLSFEEFQEFVNNNPKMLKEALAACRARLGVEDMAHLDKRPSMLPKT